MAVPPVIATLDPLPHSFEVRLSTPPDSVASTWAPAAASADAPLMRDCSMAASEDAV